MQRAALKEDKIEKEEEVKPDFSLGSTSTVSKKWYFSLTCPNNVLCFNF